MYKCSDISLKSDTVHLPVALCEIDGECYDDTAGYGCQRTEIEYSEQYSRYIKYGREQSAYE